ncbi:MAG: hypothetical protein AAFX08_02660 [Pseudomonadota bacterium]
MAKSSPLHLALICAALCICPAAAQTTEEQAPQEIDADTEDRGDVAPIELEAPIPDPDAKNEKRKDKDDDGEPEKKAEGEKPKSARLAAGGRVLAEARAALKKRGCAAAAPAYRVAAAMGEGFEAAQHELGDCLLEMEGETATETALFHQEGMFWLVRAAHAGNARAQRRLAILHASPVAGAHDPVAALRWSLAYQKNPEADLFGRGPLPRTMVEGLKQDLPEAVVADAEAFAASFEATPLAAYTPPKRPGDGNNASRPSAGAPGARRPGGGGRRRPRIQPISG